MASTMTPHGEGGGGMNYNSKISCRGGTVIVIMKCDDMKGILAGNSCTGFMILVFIMMTVIIRIM